MHQAVLRRSCIRGIKGEGDHREPHYYLKETAHEVTVHTVTINLSKK